MQRLTRFLTGRAPGQSRLRPEPGNLLCAQGAPDDALFYIENGWIKISAVSPSGKEAVLALRGPGGYCGTRSLLEGHLRTTAATALTECSLVRIARTAALELIRAEPDFAELFTLYLLHQGHSDQESLTDQLTYPSEQLLARTLVRLAGRAGGEISLRINQADLASMIGTTRSRVSHFMNKFRRLGYIAYSRQGYVTVRRSLLRHSADR